MLESQWSGSSSVPPNGQTYSPRSGGVVGRPDDLRHQPVTGILQRVAEDSRKLVGDELQLAKAEISSKLKTAGKGAGFFGAAGILAFFAVGTLTAAIVLALALVLPAWAAALIVAGIYGAVAGTFALMGKQAVKQATPFAPERTVRTLESLSQKLLSAWNRGGNTP
jgi:hypothetical protein